MRMSGETGQNGMTSITRWLLATASALALVQASPGLAKDTAAAVDPDAIVAQAAQTYTFDIPAEPLPRAIADFSAVTGIQVLYTEPSTFDYTAPALKGTYTARKALDLMLGRSGLTARYTSDRAITIERPGGTGAGATVLSPITVEGRAAPKQAEIGNLPPEYAGGQVARGSKLGILGNRDMMNTPFNQTGYTSDVIANQQARTIADVVLNDPSVRASWPTTGYSAPLMIRGFAASNQDVPLGGLYGVAPAFSVDVAAAERVEILKGPSALLTAMPPLGSIGGSVNVVPKRATDAPITRLTAGYISDAQAAGHADLGRRFGPDKEFGIRLNGSYVTGDTNVDEQSRTLGSAAAGLDYRGDRLRLSVDAGYQQQNMNAPTLITFLSPGVEVPDVPDTSSNWFFPWSWADIEDYFGAGRAEFDLTPDWTVYAAAGGLITNWERLSYFPTITNVAGDLTGTPGHLKSRYVNDTQEAGVRGGLATGPVDHELTFSGTRFHRRTTALTVSAGGALASNLYDPSDAPAPGISDIDPPKTNDSTLTSFAVGDILSIYDKRIQLILGVRRQTIDSTNFSASTGAVTTEYDKSALSPAVGVVVKPWQNVSVYANYIEELQQGAIVGSTYANAGAALEPFISKQYEAGVKVDWGTLATTVSAFEITQPSGSASSPTSVFTTDGEQRNRGIELNVFGEVVAGVRVLGGLSLVDATLTGTANGANNGNDAPGVPGIQVNLGAEWDVPYLKGFTLSGRAIYTGAQKVDNANTQTLPAWTRFDIGARYRFEPYGTPVVLRANIENLFDADYWASSGYYPGWLSAGAPRTFLLSVTADF